MGERRRSANGRHKALQGKTGYGNTPCNSALMQDPARKPGLALPSLLNNVCVYCGSSPGGSPAYAAAARSLGRLMAESGVGLVYGGGGLGLMGEIAHSVLDHGGRVSGIIPEFLSAREHMLRDVTELVVVDDMHQRKKLMFDKSDGFVALPGGIGTLEELVEQLTWAQLGRHSKPIVLLNVDGFWAPFSTLLNHMRSHGFIRPAMDVRFITVDSPEEVLPAMRAMVEPSRREADAAVAEKF
jgi:uncharacterized protein (TIGR00730 family)